jgi:hypothetical protein
MTNPKRKPGRPPSGIPHKIPKTFKLSPDIVAFLSEQRNATETIENAVRKTKEFREWRKTNEQ